MKAKHILFLKGKRAEKSLLLVVLHQACTVILPHLKHITNFMFLRDRNMPGRRYSINQIDILFERILATEPLYKRPYSSTTEQMYTKQYRRISQ